MDAATSPDGAEFGGRAVPAAADVAGVAVLQQDPLATAKQNMVVLCTECMEMEVQMKYYSLALYDEALRLVELHGGAASLRQQIQPSDNPGRLFIMGAACVLLMLDKFWPAANAADVVKLVLAAAAEFESAPACTCEQDLLGVKRILAAKFGELMSEDRPLMTDFIEELHSSDMLQQLPEFQYVQLDTCFCICDLLCGNTALQGSLRSGGKLLAVSVIGAAYVIQVPFTEVPTIPLISCISLLSKCPPDIIEAQIELIVRLIIDVE